MDPALIFAIFRRLTGYPLDPQGHPLLDSSTGLPLNRDQMYGFRIPLLKQGNTDQILSRDNPNGLRLWTRGYEPGQYIQVPVWLESIERRQWENVFPCVSFTVSDVTPSEDPYLFDIADGLDGIGSDLGTQTITNPTTGYQITTPDHRTTRKHPEPWDVWITFSLYSRNPIQMAMMERVLLVLFPQKSAIEVEQQDGTYRALDFFFDRYSVMDQGEAYDPQTGIGADKSAYLHRSCTYRFETSLDNSYPGGGFSTNDWTTEYMISERILEIANIQNTLVLQTVNLETMLP